MKYTGRALGSDTELSVEREGLRIGGRFVDYADVAELRPISHRVYVYTLAGEQIEISMLGFSFDGFWKELTDCYGARSLESLFVEEERIMLCEGEYSIPGASGRANIALYPDAVCILPENCRAIRIPLCYAREIVLNGYWITIAMQSGAVYWVGKMGYDTQPFCERAVKASDAVKRERERILAKTPLAAPFNEKGLFRTKEPDVYWNAAVTGSVCALEFFTGGDSATYLYRFAEPRDVFIANLREATEAMGTHREIIYLPEDQIAAKPLYRMAVFRSAAVRYLRERSDGRLIHNATHSARLAEYLGK